MKDLLRRLARDESGLNLVEICLLAAFMAAVVTAVVVADPGIAMAVRSVFLKAKAAFEHRAR
jgi:Flp pilus assembly pilin Flp